MRKLILFLAAVSLVLFAEKALCYETTFSIEPEPFNPFRYEEMREQKAAPLSIRTGRFLSVDPVLNLKKAMTQPQNWNRYAYTMNNPVNRIDPDGRDDGMVGLTVLQDCQLNNCRPDIQRDLEVAKFGAFVASLFMPDPTDIGVLAAGAYKLAPALRGLKIENALARVFGGGLPRAFPTIDRFYEGVATSVKSLDLNSKTYQSANALTSRLTGFIDKLANFNGSAHGGVVVRGGDIQQRVLEVVIQKGTASADQWKAIRAAEKYAKEQGVVMRVIEVK